MYITEQHREAEAHLESARSLTSDVLERLDLQSLRFKDDGLLELQYRASVLGDAELYEIHTISRRIGAEISKRLGGAGHQAERHVELEIAALKQGPPSLDTLAKSKDGCESLSLRLDLEYRLWMSFKLLQFIDEHQMGHIIERNAMQLHASIQDLYDRKFPKTGHSKHQPSSTSHSLSHGSAQRNEGNLRRCRIYGFNVATA